MFSKSERIIFKFYDGERERAVDPMQVHYKLTVASGIDFDGDLQLFENQPPDGLAPELAKQARAEWLAAANRVRGATRAAFEIKEFSEAVNASGELATVGLSDLEVDMLLNQFNLYMVDLEKKVDTYLKSLGVTDSPPDDESPTDSGSDSGLIDTEQNEGEPGSLSRLDLQPEMESLSLAGG